MRGPSSAKGKEERAGSPGCTRATRRAGWGEGEASREGQGQGPRRGTGRGRARAAAAHRAARLVVVLVHGRARVRPVLARVRELPGHEHPEVGILAAAAPLPALARRPLVVRVAAADGGGALGTGARDGEGHAGRGDGVHEGRLAGGCGEGMAQAGSWGAAALPRPPQPGRRARQPRGKREEPRCPPDPLWLAQPLRNPHFTDEQTEAWGS